MTGELDVSTAAEMVAELGTITVSPPAQGFPRPGTREEVEHLNAIALTDEKRNPVYKWTPPAQRTEH